MRHLFGYTAGDFVIALGGATLAPIPNAAGTVWTAKTGGSQHTDLLASDGSTPITAITSEPDGRVGFYGPEGVTSCWVDFGAGRYRMDATPAYPDGGTVSVTPRPVWIDVRDKGAVGDRSTLCTTAIQDAIDAANAAGGGAVVFPDGWYRATGLVLKSYVTLQSLAGVRPYLASGSGPTARGGAVIEAPPGTTNGWVIDTPSSNSFMMAVLNLGVKGTGSGGTVGGIRLQNVDYARIDQVGIYNCGAEGLYMVAGNCAHISGVLALNCLMATPTAASGAIRLGAGANDNTLDKLEGTTLTSFGGPPSDSNLYNASLMIEGGTNFIFGCQAELSDRGLYVTGIQNKFIGLRADNNAGHGIVVAGSKNQFIGCQSLNNGYVNNTYDGFRAEVTVGHGNKFIGCISNRNDGKTYRYAFADDTNNGLIEVKNQWVGCAGSQWATAEFSTVSFLGSGVLHAPHPIRPADGTTVIDVTGTSFVKLTGYATATTVTNFSGGTEGQSISVLGKGVVTIANNSTIKTSTGANKLLSSSKIYRFTLCDSVWIEDA